MAFKLPSREELLSSVRKKTEELKAGRRDPDQFNPPKAQKEEIHEFIFRVLPNLMNGEKHKTGICTQDSEIWYLENGTHYINNERYSCPRIHDRVECPLCKMGFDLIADETDEKLRKSIIRNYLATSYWAINIYFPNLKKNPEHLRGKVMWYNAPKGIFTKMENCITSDDSGDESDPKACGIFYHPLEGYNFKLVVSCKSNGKESFNNYDSSVFLASSLSPLIKNEDGTPNEDEIQKILDQRHFLTEKFQPRNIDKIQALVNKIQNASTGNDDSENINTKTKDEELPEKVKMSKPAPEKASSSLAKPKLINDDDDIPDGLVKGGASAVKSKSIEAKPVEQKKVVVEEDDDEDDAKLADLMANIKQKQK